MSKMLAELLGFVTKVLSEMSVLRCLVRGSILSVRQIWLQEGDWVWKSVWCN